MIITEEAEMRKLTIIPDVLTSDVREVEEKLQRIKGISRHMHIDIIDGVYADNLTIAPADLQGVDFREVKFDLHVMVDDPMAWVEEMVAIRPGRIIAQVERMGSQIGYVEWVKGYEVGVGLGVDLYTPIESLEKEALEQVEVVLLMSVRAGFSGQKFDGRVVEKIKKLRKIYKGAIMVDGGINPETAKLVMAAGATEVAVNSYLWEGEVSVRMKKMEESYGRKEV